RDHWRIHLHEIIADEIVIDGRRFEFLELPPAGNRGLRFHVDGEGGSTTVGITGDSNFHAQAIHFLRGTDLGVFDSGHLTDDEIVDLAVESGAPRLVCSHVYRELDLEALGERARRRGYSGVLEMGHDLQSFGL
ncbi:MAG: hypothetical protein AAFX50_26185, partial [Acidobacteriota bacterium]